MEQIIAEADICADFDHSIIQQNSLSIPVVDYGWESLFSGKLEKLDIPMRCLLLGGSYLLNKIFRKDADQETIKHRAGFVRGFPYSLFEECALGKLSINQNFLRTLDELSTIRSINKNIVVVTRNMESLVETYLNSTHEFGIPVHQYVEELSGFKFVIVGNELETAYYDEKKRATGVIMPGNNAALLLNDSLISMLTKIDIYSDKIILSDREEVSNRDVKKQGKKGEYLIINMQAPRLRIVQKLYSAGRFLQNKHPLAVQARDIAAIQVKDIAAMAEAEVGIYAASAAASNPAHAFVSALVSGNDAQLNALTYFVKKAFGSNLVSIIGYGSYFRKPSKPKRRPDFILIVDDYTSAYDSLGDVLCWTKRMKDHNVQLNMASINYYNLRLNVNSGSRRSVNVNSDSENGSIGDMYSDSCFKFKIGIISRNDLARKARTDFYVSGRMSKENILLYCRSIVDLLFMQNIVDAMRERFVYYAMRMCSGKTSKEEFLTKYLSISYLAEPYRWFDRKSASMILESETCSEGKVSDVLFAKLVKHIPPENLVCGICSSDTEIAGLYFDTSLFEKARAYLEIFLQGISGFRQSWKNHFETNKKYSNDPVIPREYFREKRRK